MVIKQSQFLKSIDNGIRLLSANSHSFKVKV